MNGWRGFAASTLAGLLAAGTAGAAETAQHSVETDWGRITLSTGINYSTGDYGQDQSTDILYVPLTGKWEVQDWVFRLTVPYVSVTGPGNVVQGSGVVGTPTRQRTTESGLGDVVAGASRTIYENRGTGTAVDVTAKVKLPTADPDRGLGTGEADYFLAIEPAQQWGAVTLFGTLGYKLAGDPPGSDLNNVVFASLGFTAPVAPATSAGLSLDVQGRSSDASSSAQREITAFASHRLSETWQAQAYVSRGLAEASPDWSGGLTASLRF